MSEDLQERIAKRFWRCNELSEKSADDYAWIAVNEMKRWLAECKAQTPYDSGPNVIISVPNHIIISVPNPAANGKRISTLMRGIE